MTPANQLKRDIAYHLQICIVETERCLKLIEPQMRSDKSTYLLDSKEAKRIERSLNKILEDLRKVLVEL